MRSVASPAMKNMKNIFIDLLARFTSSPSIQKVVHDSSPLIRALSVHNMFLSELMELNVAYIYFFFNYRFVRAFFYFICFFTLIKILFQQSCENSYNHTIDLATLVEDCLRKPMMFKGMNTKQEDCWTQRPLSDTHEYLMARDTALLLSLFNLYKEDHIKTVSEDCQNYADTEREEFLSSLMKKVGK
jgi:hypothetical protein